jgi:hypothetical protein
MESGDHAMEAINENNGCILAQVQICMCHVPCVITACAECGACLVKMQMPAGMHGIIARRSLGGSTDLEPVRAHYRNALCTAHCLVGDIRYTAAKC